MVFSKWVIVYVLCRTAAAGSNCDKQGVSDTEVCRCGAESSTLLCKVPNCYKTAKGLAQCIGLELETLVVRQDVVAQEAKEDIVITLLCIGLIAIYIIWGTNFFLAQYIQRGEERIMQEIAQDANLERQSRFTSFIYPRRK
eukprot:GEMP01084274.1.p1 GENE.GEMP01084274.1~~GEMP01084274.1.p1  ORF type:complete len:141 (+),score=14.23 GEMP01084274.1:113-535(+)